MKRRDFLTLIGSAAAWPLAARAQQAVMPVIGFLNTASPDLDSYVRYLSAFRLGLKETGYIEGQNVAIEYRWAEGRYDRLPALAADLVRRRVAVIYASAPPSIVAAKAATSVIPIVFQMGADPIGLGLVSSLNRPGGNITGVSHLVYQLEPKRLELLHEVAPSVGVMAALLNPDNPESETQSRDLREGARKLGLQLHVLNANSDADLESAFATLLRLRAGALTVGADPFLFTRCDKLVALTARHALPAIYEVREFAAAGGLMSYGTNIADAYRLAGVYTGRILKGAKPTDLPVVQSAKFELVINLKTANTLGLTVPQTLLVSADDVIE
jgi:putative tryptophan/tyrosine transport system substrate-binding protein